MQTPNNLVLVRMLNVAADSMHGLIIPLPFVKCATMRIFIACYFNIIATYRLFVYGGK